MVVWSGANNVLENQVRPFLHAQAIPHRIETGSPARVFVLAEDFLRVQSALEEIIGGSQAGSVQQGRMSEGHVCVLCRAEYRTERSECSTCGAAVLHGQGNRSARMVWRIDHRETSRAVLGALRDAGIACHHRGINEHWIHALLLKRPEFEVWILKSDAARAHDVLMHMEKSPEFREEAPEIVEQAAQQCPFCHAENPEGYGACACCGIDLLVWRQQPFQPAEGDSPVLLWKGSDLVGISRIVGRLQGESIPFSFLPNWEHIVFELAAARPRWEIRVYNADAEKAFSLIADIHEPFPFVDTSNAEDSTEAAVETGSAIPQESPSSVFNLAAADAEAWTGKDPGVAQALRLAWRENGIESWTIDDPDGTQHLWVEGMHVERAKQITREVIGESVSFET